MGNNSTLLAIGAAVIGFFLLKGGSGGNTNSVGGSAANVDQYNGAGVTINGTFLPFQFLDQNGYEFLGGEWLSPAGVQQFFVDNTPGAHWTTFVGPGLDAALDIFQQFQGGGN